MALLSLVAKLGLDKTGFEQGINSASKRVSSFGAGLKTALAGAFSVAAVGAFLRSLDQTIGRIKDLSEQFAVTTDEVQNVDFALKQSGLAFEDLGQAMAKMGQARRDAVEGGPNADDLRKTFEKYGITLEQLNSPQMRNFDLLMKMSKAMSGMNLTAREQVEIQDLLGQRASKLAHVLANLTETKPPSLFTQDDIERIDKASKSLDNLYATMQKMAAGPISRFAETLNQGLQEWSNQPGEWWQKIFTADPEGGPFAKALKAALFGGGTERNKVTEKAVAQLVEFENKMQNNAQDKGGLFQVDKLKKIAPEARAPLERPSSQLTSMDQLGRIGAFSGGGVGSLQGQMKKTADTLVEIRNVLAIRGIVIKDL